MFFSQNLEREHSLGSTSIHSQTGRPLYIRICLRLQRLPKEAYMTLLHEMCHVANSSKNGHGPWFHKEMLRLAKAGAFKNLW